MYLCFIVSHEARLEKHIFDSDRDDIEISLCFSSLSIWSGQHSIHMPTLLTYLLTYLLIFMLSYLLIFLLTYL